MSDFRTVQKLASSKGLQLVCRYRYELRDNEGMLFWAYNLSDIENYLRSLIHA